MFSTSYCCETAQVKNKSLKKQLLKDMFIIEVNPKKE